MPTRRSFLGALGVFSAFAALPACEASLGQPSRPALPRYAPLPPLGDDVFRRRQDRARALVREAGAEAAFVTSGTTTFAYLAGARVERSERLIALLLPVDGDPVLVGPAFELERLRRQTRVRDLRGWEEQESPYAVVKDALGAARAKASLLVEPHAEYLTTGAPQGAFARLSRESTSHLR